MPWTYRVVKRTWVNRENGDSEDEYAIHEAFDEGDIEKPHSISWDPVAPHGDTPEELKADYDRMATAFTRSPLDWDTFGRDRSRVLVKS